MRRNRKLKEKKIKRYVSHNKVKVVKDRLGWVREKGD